MISPATPHKSPPSHFSLDSPSPPLPSPLPTPPTSQEPPHHAPTPSTPYPAASPLTPRPCPARSKRPQQPCGANAMHGRSLCYHHGGRRLVGPASGQYRTGRYSDYLPVRMAEKYHHALRDPQLLS